MLHSFLFLPNSVRLGRRPSPAQLFVQIVPVLQDQHQHQQQQHQQQQQQQYHLQQQQRQQQQQQHVQGERVSGV